MTFFTSRFIFSTPLSLLNYSRTDVRSGKLRGLPIHFRTTPLSIPITKAFFTSRKNSPTINKEAVKLMKEALVKIDNIQSLQLETKKLLLEIIRQAEIKPPFQISDKPLIEDRELTFEEFKSTQVESFEDYRNSQIVIYLFKNNNDPNAVKEAYESYCKSEYFQYKRARIGGNPARMI